VEALGHQRLAAVDIPRLLHRQSPALERKKENFEALACEPIYGYIGKSSNPEHIVLDGQQRLTAMYYAFMAPNVPAPDRSNRFLYYLRVDKFMQEAYDDAFVYEWSPGKFAALAAQEVQYKSHTFPLSVIGQEGWALPNWVQGYEQYWRSRAKQAHDMGDSATEVEALHNADNAAKFGEHVRGITQEYQVAYIELDRDLELDKICDIFTQINSRGIRLDIFDLINALLRPQGLQLRHMWREHSQRLSFVNTDRMNIYILQVMSILRQGYCSPKYLYYLLPGQERQVREADGSLRKEVLVKDVKDFERRWGQAVDSLERAIKMLQHPQEFGAILSQYLPYVSILPAFAALQAEARRLPANRRLDAQRKIRHWYWASIFTNRYSGSVESTTARDFLDVKTWFDDDAAQPALIIEFRERFRNIDLRRETRRGTSVYNGIFNLLVVNGCRDWISGNVPQHGDLDDHHIVPKDWKGYTNGGTSIDSILNRTPLTGDTNRNVIRDRLPNEYLPEMIAANGEGTVRAILESHLISPAAFDILLRKPFAMDDFEAFLVERQRTIQDAIEDLLIKARLDLPKRLRELDTQVEAVELRLRSIVSDALQNDPCNLPPHVQQKINDRMQTAIKKNPAMDMKLYQALPAQLEFADLRELQDTINNKTLWPQFQSKFGNKETLAGRFDQLAELRNSIRHTRTVTEVVRKDGEAALVWFSHVLNL
jgi:hypothetical protein